MANMKKPAPKKPMTPKVSPKGVKVPMPKKPGAAPAKKTLMPKVTPKSPGKRQQIPPDYDVIIPGMGYTKPGKNQPPKKINKSK
jgi:hypothetical protein